MKHHKRGSRMIRQISPPLGYSPKDLVRLASIVARYHRGALPSTSQKSFARLSAAQQKRTLLLAGILRLADSLKLLATASSKESPLAGSLIFPSFGFGRRVRSTQPRGCTGRRGAPHSGDVVWPSADCASARRAGFQEQWQESVEVPIPQKRALNRRSGIGVGEEAACKRRTASGTSHSSTTNVRLISEAPCEIMRMLTSASSPNTRAAIPGVSRKFSPTRQTIAFRPSYFTSAS